eukprot:UN06530
MPLDSGTTDNTVAQPANICTKYSRKGAKLTIPNWRCSDSMC